MTAFAPEQSFSTLTLGGVPVTLDCSGALWLEQARTLVFSDLHFEKGSSYGARGLFLPPFDTRQTLKNMASVIAQFQPQRIISLGDAFHDGEAEGRMAQEDAAQLEELTTAHEWVWILGNHDPEPPARFGGQAVDRVEIGGLGFSHAPEAEGAWQVVGHMHPAAKVAKTGRTVRRRCFVTDGTRIILPSFGAYTGGLNVLDDAYRPFFAIKPDVWMLGKTRVYQVPRAALRRDGINRVYACKR